VRWDARTLPPNPLMASTNPYEKPRTIPGPDDPLPPDTPWWKLLNKHHWFVLTMATLAWVFDCLDQQLFILARPAAMKALAMGADEKELAGIATSIFVIGWAVGGLIFGAVGDRIGRARTLTITVLIYSLCTGLSAFAQDFTQFAIYRFITGLGVGGVFGLAVALVADSLPEAARSKALGTLQAMSALGNITAGLSSIYVAGLAADGVIKPGETWKYLFWIGALPAFLCVPIAWRMREPEKWVKARAEGKITGVKFGSYASLFGDAKWRRHALAGMLLCIAGVIGVWGIGFFSPELVGGVIERSLKAEGVDAAKIASEKSRWMGYNSIVQNIGAFFGMIVFTKVAQRIGRKQTFVIGSVAAMAATIFFFLNFDGKGDIWMSSIMGFFQLALFAGFAIYLPELFPIRLRSTGISFCYNVGRFIAAAGPWTLGVLQGWLATRAAAAAASAGEAAVTAAKLDAFRSACCWLTGIYLVGLLALPFLPETKGQPLPED
jgi:MFS family permease